jgi:hypothetical protein
MLTMQPSEMKRRIIGEAHRLLKAGGRYAIHEMCLIEDDLDEDRKNEINLALSRGDTCRRATSFSFRMARTSGRRRL